MGSSTDALSNIEQTELTLRHVLLRAHLLSHCGLCRPGARAPFPIQDACFRYSWFLFCSTFIRCCFLFAHPTDPSQLDMNTFDAAHLRHLPRYRKPIHCVAVEIANHSALRADEMVMPIRVGIKPRSVSHEAHTRYYAAIFEQPQCSIDSVDRDGRNPLPHPHENRIGIWMFLTTGQLPKNLGSLMSSLDALTTANL